MRKKPKMTLALIAVAALFGPACGDEITECLNCPPPPATICGVFEVDWYSEDCDTGERVLMQTSVDTLCTGFDIIPGCPAVLIEDGREFRCEETIYEPCEIQLTFVGTERVTSDSFEIAFEACQSLAQQCGELPPGEECQCAVLSGTKIDEVSIKGAAPTQSAFFTRIVEGSSAAPQ